MGVEFLYKIPGPDVRLLPPADQRGDKPVSTEVQPTAPISAAIMEKVLVGGDLAQLSPQDRVTYYGKVCESLGLNPLTQPFAYIELNDKLTLYAKRDCTDQLRKVHGINVVEMTTSTESGVHVVRVTVRDKDGRTDMATGAVAVTKEGGEWKSAQSGKRYFAGNGQFQPLAPDDHANAIMKAETKAKRRATLSICGLGWLDETEIETIADARPVTEPAPPPPTRAPNLERTPKRLFAALKSAGVAEDGFRAYLAARFDPPVASTKDLTPEQFDLVLSEIDSGIVAEFVDGKEF